MAPLPPPWPIVPAPVAAAAAAAAATRAGRPHPAHVRGPLAPAVERGGGERPRPRRARGAPAARLACAGACRGGGEGNPAIMSARSWRPARLCAAAVFSHLRRPRGLGPLPFRSFSFCGAHSMAASGRRRVPHCRQTHARAETRRASGLPRRRSCRTTCARASARPVRRTAGWCATGRRTARMSYTCKTCAPPAGHRRPVRGPAGRGVWRRLPGASAAVTHLQTCRMSCICKTNAAAGRLPGASAASMAGARRAHGRLPGRAAAAGLAAVEAAA